MRLATILLIAAISLGCMTTEEPLRVKEKNPIGVATVTKDGRTVAQITETDLKDLVCYLVEFTRETNCFDVAHVTGINCRTLLGWIRGDLILSETELNKLALYFHE